jgi:hypothetical protein
MDDAKATQMIAAILTAGRTEAATIFGASVADVVATLKPDAETILEVMSRVTLSVAGDAYTPLKKTREILQPFLDVQIAREQSIEQQKLARSNFWLTIAALILATVQTAAAGIQIYQIVKSP